MDDLSMIAELNRDEPLAGPAELAGARDRLLTAAAAEHLSRPAHPATGFTTRLTAGITTDRTAGPASRAGSTSAGTPAAATARGTTDTGGTTGTGGPSHVAAGAGGTGRRRWRLAAAVGLTASVAAGIAAVLVLGPTAPIAGHAPVASADAREVLHQAAVAAVARPDLHPRPDQFVYLRTLNGGSGQAARTYQVWLSADGRRDGLIDNAGERMVLPGCSNGRQPVRDKQDRVIPGQTQECMASPGYRTDLPTTADAMLAWLQRNASGTPGDINAVGKDVLGLAGASYLPPRSLGALFEAASRLRGMQVIPDSTDAAGRHGVGVSWLKDGTRMTLIFDSRTHAFLGTSYAYGGQNGRPLTATTALTRVAVVNRPGQQR